MTDEAIFSYVNQFTDERVRLNLCEITDIDVFLYFNKRANKYITPNGTPIKVDWIDDCHAIPKFNVDNTGLFDSGLIQNAPPSLQCFGRKRKLTSLPVSIDSYIALMSSRLFLPTRPSTRCGPLLLIHSTTYS